MSKRRRARTANPLPETPKMRVARQEISAVIDRAFAPHLIGQGNYSNPENIKADLAAILAKHFAPPPPRPVDLSLVSDEAWERAGAQRVLVERPITRQSIRAMKDRVAKLWFWKPRHMAAHLGISRSQLENIQAGRREISEEFAARFRLLEQLVAAWTLEHQERERNLVVVESEKPLPRRWRVLRRIVKCSRCNVHFEQVNGRHKRCHTPECDARKPRRKKK